VRPVSACALAAAFCLLALPIEPASAAPHAPGRGHVVHRHIFVAPHVARTRAGHHGLHRHARSNRFNRHHGFAGGWPGYFDGFAAPYAPALLGDSGPAEVAAVPSVLELPVLVGIREAAAAQPAIIAVGPHRARSANARGAMRSAQYAAPGPLVIELAPGRR
jgi:hypothetical protein